MIKLLKFPELKNTFIISLGFFSGSFFSYLLQFYLGRTLSVSDYGSFNALLSILALVSSVGFFFTLPVIKVITELKSKREDDKISSIFYFLIMLVLVFGIFIAFLVFIFSNKLSTYLKVNDTRAIIGFGIASGISILTLIPASFMQGLLLYGKYSFYMFIANFLRFLVPFILVFYGHGLLGIFIGLSVSVLLSYFIGHILVFKNLSRFVFINIGAEIQQIFKYGVLSFLMTTLLYSYTNIDVVLVKIIANPSDAGFYSGTVTLGKILLYGGSFVVLAMFPAVSRAYSENKDINKTFVRFLLIQLGVVIMGVFIFSHFSTYISHLFFGARFNSSIMYLPKYSIFVGLFLLLNFIVQFLFAVNKKIFVVYLLLGLLLQILGIIYYGNSLNKVLNINIFCLAICVSLSTLSVVKVLYKKQ